MVSISILLIGLFVNIKNVLQTERVQTGSDPSKLLLLQGNTHEKGHKTVLECTFRGLKGHSKGIRDGAKTAF